MITTVYADTAWWNRYDSACYHAALDQGLAPMALRLAAAKVPFAVEQTGGFCMTIGSYLTKDHGRYIWVTNVRECVEPGTTADDLRWYACEYHDLDPDRDWTERLTHATCKETAALLATELVGWGVDCSPDVEGSEALYRDAYSQGLPPMALRLALAEIPFTVERPDGEATVLQVPVAQESHLWVTAAGGSYTDDTEDLRWSLNLGEPVVTAEAIAIIHAERNKAKNDG